MAAMLLNAEHVKSNLNKDKLNNVTEKSTDINNDKNTTFDLSTIDLSNIKGGVAKNLDTSICKQNFKDQLTATINVTSGIGIDLKKNYENKYYDLPCPKEWQDYIFNLSNETGVPSELIMTIIHQESGGTWDTNGKISVTHDYGLTQINQCNLSEIKNVLGITKEEVLNDPYKAMTAQTYLLQNIMNMYGYTNENIDYLNVCGTYNGWTNWEKKEMSQDYVASCQRILEEKFGISSQRLK